MSRRSLKPCRDKRPAVQAEDHPRITRTAEFRFYEELNDFLPPQQRKVAFGYCFEGTPAVRDLIQAIGVPHSAVDLVLVDGRSVGFDERLQGGERVAVYPVFERFDISPLTRLRPQPLREPKFALDVHLGKLARGLRLLGFDSVYHKHWDDAAIIDFALANSRIILTRDVGLLKHARVTHGYWVRSTEPDRQQEEVVGAFDLARLIRPFTRCLECNGQILPVDRERVRERLAPAVAERFEHFWHCSECSRIYWRGTHYRRLLRRVRAVAGEDATDHRE